MDDPFTGSYVARDIRRRLPNAHLVELNGVGHFPQCELPERVANEILASFRKA
jgi:pimeloyl-ACP methyl ester carboxylesterase